MHLDQLEWISVHYKEAAFAPPGPAGRIEAAIGQPKHSLATGKDTKKQHVLMWKTYCENLEGQLNADVDLTLFSIPGKKQAYYYISEGPISEAWPGIKELANDPNAQLNDDDDDDGESEKKGAEKKPAPKAEPKPAPKAAAKVEPKPEPKKPEPKRPEPKPAPTPAPKKASKTVALKKTPAPTKPAPAPAAAPPRPVAPPPSGAVGKVAPPARGAASLSGRPTLPASSDDI